MFALWTVIGTQNETIFILNWALHVIFALASEWSLSDITDGDTQNYILMK